MFVALVVPQNIFFNAKSVNSKNILVNIFEEFFRKSPKKGK